MVHGHLPDLLLGGCSAWSLPADETCARVARSHLRVVLAAMNVPAQLMEDVLLAVSELATNGLRHGIGAAPLFPGQAVLELWAYHRVTPESQLVFKVFDPKPHWASPAQGIGAWAENGRASRSWRPCPGGGAGTGRGPVWDRVRCLGRRPGSASPSRRYARAPAAPTRSLGRRP